ncbi:MAG: hypothetical protein HQL67_09610 [Magnetococcales bacterium]|nr:hypothetical protein [Magnetococcales bacterium]
MMNNQNITVQPKTEKSQDFSVVRTLRLQPFDSPGQSEKKQDGNKQTSIVSDSPDQLNGSPIPTHKTAASKPMAVGLKTAKNVENPASCSGAAQTVGQKNESSRAEEFVMDPQFKESDLPGSLVEIKEVVGLQGALTLLNRCGGTRLFIPRRLKAQHKLADLLGLEAARLMSAYFGGETLTIVRGSRAKKLARNRSLIRRYNGGERVAELAVAFELTERQVYTILSKDNG